MASLRPVSLGEINLGRFLIREWRRGDEVSLVRHANNPKVSRTLREIFPYPYTADDATQRISFATTKNPTTDFAIIVDGEAVGGIGFMLLGDVAAGLLKSATGLPRPTGGRES